LSLGGYLGRRGAPSSKPRSSATGWERRGSALGAVVGDQERKLGAAVTNLQTKTIHWHG
jgi:hypothetical protein